MRLQPEDHAWFFSKKTVYSVVGGGYHCLGSNGPVISWSLDVLTAPVTGFFEKKYCSGTEFEEGSEHIEIHYSFLSRRIER